ncbi:MAG TPA: hypothetical protein VIU11_06585, partial [Nakamurella sp.]
MTSTLETALANLPAKPRVHELSKRVGTTSKEMLAVLGERGLTISSASASVPREVAVAVIEHYLGTPVPVEVVATPETPPEASAEAVEEAPAEADEAAPVEAVPPAPVADPFNPLFLPPSETTATAIDRPGADAPSESAAPAAPAGGPRRSRRRRGRSAGRPDPR